MGKVKERPTKAPKGKYGSPLIDEAIAGMQQLVDDMNAGKAVTVREVSINLAIPEITAEEIKAIRESLGLSQALFAEFLGTSASSVRAWEQDERHPTAMGRRFLDAIRSDPDYWRAKLANVVTSKQKVVTYGSADRRK